MKKTGKKGYIIIAGSFILVVAFTAVFLFLSSKEPSIVVEKGKVEISGSYGETIPTDSIRDVSLVDNVPAISYRANGLGLGKIKKGNFKTKDGHFVKLFLQESKGPFIKIIHNGGQSYYINFKDSDKTNHCYRIIRDALSIQ
ncbi:MAG: hypothetical protein LBL78_01945 [Prevotellaceae bacterium]|jgi:hypothetical protein|nr:hypothetical protein [Prevotellaceae bacterium]